MSRQTALDNINLIPTDRWGHTEYSLRFHPGDIRGRTGLHPDTPEAQRSFYDAWELDFIWAVDDGLHKNWKEYGRTTEMGHAVYQADGGDKQDAEPSPFKDPEDVWAFDAVKEYGLPDRAEQIAAYQAHLDTFRTGFPHQLTTGGYYKTMVSGAIESFGWDMFLMALTDPGQMETVLDSFFRYTQFHMNAWAETDAEVIIQHDDFVWSEGAFMHPDIYRNVIIPRYAELWKPLHAAGKKVLFCSDANFVEFAEDVAAAGADGFIFEPMNDFSFMVEHFGDSHCLVGSCMDCRDLTLGHWDKFLTDMDQTFALLKQCRGAIVSVGNHLPANIPDEMMERYVSTLLPRLARDRD